jgi:hypothetical protein
VNQPQKRYSIEKLLAEGIQPFQNLTDEQRDDLERDIVSKGKKLDKMPVYLSADEILYDGHQRLLILLKLGRKTIGEDEIIRNPKIKGHRATRMEAIKINRNRRHLTGKAMADVIWDLVLRYGMSQTAIGKEIGMRQQSVSELMDKYPPNKDEMPEEIVTTGEDGKTYTRTAPVVTPPKMNRPRPWQYRGKADTAIRKAHLMLREMPDDLTESEMQDVDELLTGLQDAIEVFLTYLRDLYLYTESPE